jgi:hypothetical protein
MAAPAMVQSTKPRAMAFMRSSAYGPHCNAWLLPRI